MNQTIGITGSTGFVGSALATSLTQAYPGAVRRLTRSPAASSDHFCVGEIGPYTKWLEALHGLDVVIHCAAQVHRPAEKENIHSFRLVNTEGTLHLAKSAVQSGVKRFVFISSVKVMGELNRFGRAFHHLDTPEPSDPYGRSKYEAEGLLRDLSRETGLEVVIIRPPLVYGPGVGANFRRMLKTIHAGVPLPFGSIQNKRSLVSVNNLIDLIRVCAVHPNAPGNLFFVSDGRDMSTPELVREILLAMNRPDRLFRFPVLFLRSMSILFGKSEAIERLTNSLQVDIEHTRHILGWSPFEPMEDAIKSTVNFYLKHEANP